MSDNNNHVEVLVLNVPSQTPDYVWPKRVPDFPRRAVEAALATSNDARAWALVRLAADLRASDDQRKALAVLDLAWGMEPSAEPAAAMFTCAIACHCDNDDFLTAHVVANDQPDAYRDTKFARVACRLYATLLAETGEERWKLELERHLALLDVPMLVELAA